MTGDTLKDDDPIESILTDTREKLEMGVDRFSFPAAVVLDLLNQSDELADLHRYQVEYGINALLNFLPDDGARERLLTVTVGANPNAEGIYELQRGTHTGCFWKQGNEWNWFIRLPDGTCF